MKRAIPATVLLAFVAGSLMSGCTTPASPQELAAVERMIQQTESMRTQLNGPDTTALRHMGALFQAERPGIEQRFGDTLLRPEAEVLGNYHRAMAERLPRLMQARRAERARLDSTLIRLRHLRHDLDQGLMTGKKRQAALHMEERWNTALRQDLDSLAARTQALIQERTSYRAAIDSLLRQ